MLFCSPCSRYCSLRMFQIILCPILRERIVTLARETRGLRGRWRSFSRKQVSHRTATTTGRAHGRTRVRSQLLRCVTFRPDEGEFFYLKCPRLSNFRCASRRRAGPRQRCLLSSVCRSWRLIHGQRDFLPSVRTNDARARFCFYSPVRVRALVAFIHDSDTEC